MSSKAHTHTESVVVYEAGIGVKANAHYPGRGQPESTACPSMSCFRTCIRLVPHPRHQNLVIGAVEELRQVYVLKPALGIPNIRGPFPSELICGSFEAPSLSRQVFRPKTLDECIPEEHLARVVKDAGDSIDMDRFLGDMNGSAQAAVIP